MRALKFFNPSQSQLAWKHVYNFTISFREALFYSFYESQTVETADENLKILSAFTGCINSSQGLNKYYEKYLVENSLNIVVL